MSTTLVASRVYPRSSNVQWTFDRLFAFGVLFAIVLNPALDVVVGVLWDPEQGAGIGKVLRGAWILLGLMYSVPNLVLKRPNKLQVALLCLLTLGIYVFAVEVFVGDISTAVDAGARIVYLLVSVAVAYVVATRGALALKAFTTAAIVGGILLSIAVIAGGVGGLGLRNPYKSDDLAITTTVFSAQTTAAMPLLVYGIVGLVRQRIKFRLLGLSLLAVLSALTAVRAAMLAYGVCGLAYAFLGHPAKRIGFWTSLSRVMVSSVLALSLGCGVLVTSPDVMSRWSDTTGSGRTTFQSLVIADIASRSLPDLLTGVGRDHTKGLLARRFGMSIGAHNDLLDICSGYGVIGVTLFTIAVGLLVWEVAKQRRNMPLSTEAKLAVIVWLIASMTHGSLNYMSLTFIVGSTIGFMLGCGTSLGAQIQRCRIVGADEAK